ncbi:MAG: trypsin-like peptidase domain-containing protein [Brevinematales bacterium]|nr:trypsin-like peptidase domain-containing protein [Brevinematales bacterium]
MRMRKFPVIAMFFIITLPAMLGAQSKTESVFKQTYIKYKDVVVRLSNNQGMGSGFLTAEGFVITADHVVGTSVNVQMDYNGQHFFLRPCYRDHANDIAILYPLGYSTGKNDYRDVPYNYLKGKSKISVAAPNIASEDPIMVMGYPYGIIELKRILGTYKDEVYRYMENVPLYACDLPVIKGCSGGPVFNTKEEVIGIAVKFEAKPTDTEYLISYVSPAKNIEKILKNLDKKYMDMIDKIDKNIPAFSLAQNNMVKQKAKYISGKNVKTVEESGTEYIVNKSKSGYYVYNDNSISAVNMFFDLYMDTVEKNKREGKCVFEIYLKWMDEKNYVSMKLDMDENRYFFVYMIDGQEEIKEPIIDMPIVSETMYNIEFFTADDTMGIFFDNIPVYYDSHLPFESGSCGIFFSEMKTLIIQDLLIRIPKNY